MVEREKISFIIVNYKSSKYLEKSVASIFERAKNIEKEIVAVNISDALGLSKDIKLINISENKGLGNACNIGEKQASGNILCFLNPDTEIISEDLDRIISGFENNPEVGIIGPKLIQENNEIQDWSAGKEINLLDIILNNIGFKRSKKVWTSDRLIECAWVSGACLFIRKELFQKLKGFDEKFFMYFEDSDLCRRARNLGYKILYFPEFTVKHLGGKSFDDKNEQKKLYYQSQDYYFEKHFGKITSNLVKLIREMTRSTQ